MFRKQKHGKHKSVFLFILQKTKNKTKKNKKVYNEKVKQEGQMQMKVQQITTILAKPPISFRKFEHNEELFKKAPVFKNNSLETVTGETEPKVENKEQRKWKTHN